ERSAALLNLTRDLVETYRRCSPEFRYQPKLAPKRVLTQLSQGVHNNGYDNSKHDYICRVRDNLYNPDGLCYSIMERLGHGTFGQVLKCEVTGNSGATPTRYAALKIIKNKPAYFHQALVEVRILKLLNVTGSTFLFPFLADKDEDSRIVKMLDFFVFRKHLCIAFEILSINLYDVLKQNGFRGLSTPLIRSIMEQIIKALQCLRKARVIHCDLKPENVLLSPTRMPSVKLIDFGSAGAPPLFSQPGHIVYTYIQSRFYRSPEVLLGLPYTSAIDMWSLGCICAELFIGLPIFPGSSEYDQMKRITEIVGLPPKEMMEGAYTHKYFVQTPPDDDDEDQELDAP
ncbi:unnamed protein product, partial [Amoebophrya sp. A25]